MYCYSDEDFEKIDKVAEERGWKEDTERMILDKKREFSTPLFVQSIRDGVDRSAEKENRLYHPWVFQKSPEEKRLDMLLGFLSVIAWQYEKGQIRLGNIYEHFGHEIIMMANRKVIKSYFEVQNLAFRKLKRREHWADYSPMKHIQELFECVQYYDRYHNRCFIVKLL